MGKGQRPGKPGNSGPSDPETPAFKDDELERRRRSLDTALAARKRREMAERKAERTAGSAAGFATALKLSSEFIAGVLVGAAIGWLIDWLAGTTPWGMIVFLLLGFCAGVLNVMRSAGLVAERGTGDDKADTPKDG